MIDKATKKIIWQYGVTGKPGAGPGQLSIPDGLDIIKTTEQASTTPELLTPSNATTTITLYTVGQVTRQAKQFIGQQVRLQGYLLKQENGYAIFSDEATGSVGRYDLPVTGNGGALLQLNRRYELQGIFFK